MDSITVVVQQTLNELHIPMRLCGYQYLTYSIERIVAEPMRIQGITKDLYPEAARHYGTTWKAVDRANRTAINTCWERGGREKLDEVVGYHLAERPWPTEFISAVAEYIRRNQT